MNKNTFQASAEGDRVRAALEFNTQPKGTAAEAFEVCAEEVERGEPWISREAASAIIRKHARATKAPAVGAEPQELSELYEALEPVLEQLVATCNNSSSACCWQEVIAAEAALERLYKARVSAVSHVPVQGNEA